MSLLLDFEKIVAHAIEENHPKARSQATVEKPVFQSNEFPFPIALDAYNNAYSPANPEGNYLHAFRFRDLVNAIPDLTKFFTTSANTVEQSYQNLIQGASIVEDSKFVSQAFYEAQQKFSVSKMSGLSQSPTSWQLANAIPYNWTDLLTTPKSLPKIHLDLQKLPTLFDDQYQTLLPSKNAIKLQSRTPGQQDGKHISLSTDSSLETISFRYLMVQVERSWLNTELFTMNDWYLSGQPIGYYSSGSTTNNDGVFPLMITGVLLGTQIEITGSLKANDTNFIHSQLQANKEVSVAQFPVENLMINGDKQQLNANAVYLMGYVSQLIPLAPRMQSS